MYTIHATSLCVFVWIDTLFGVFFFFNIECKQTKQKSAKKTKLMKIGYRKRKKQTNKKKNNNIPFILTDGLLVVLSLSLDTCDVFKLSSIKFAASLFPCLLACNALLLLTLTFTLLIIVAFDKRVLELLL